MKRLALIASVVACLGALGVAVALAKPTKSYTTTSTLEVKKTTIAGKLSSPKTACLKNRTVHGVWLAPGQHLITEPATSNGAGKWVIRFEVAPGSKGTLAITVASKSLGKGATCKGSETRQTVIGK